MAKTDINENIYRAIDTIIDARLQNVNFNSTVLCTIVDDSKAASGIFTVDNAGIKFQATSMDKSFKVNDQVYVTVPNNNFDAQKIIIGKKEDFTKLQEQWKDPFNYLDIKYKFDDDSDEVEIIPAKNGQKTSVPVKKIILDNDISIFQHWITDELEAPGGAGTIEYNATPSENDLWIKMVDHETHEFINTYRQNALCYIFDDLYSAGWTPILQTDQTTIIEQPYKALLTDRTHNRYQVYDIPPALVNSSQILPTLQPYWDSKQQLVYYPDGTQWITWPQSTSAEFQRTDKFLLFYNEKQYSPISFAGLKNIIITADFKSNLAQIANTTTGLYYLECKLYLTNINKSTTASGVDITISSMMSSAQDFIGDPYNYFDYFTQTILFDISNYQDYVLNKIEFILHQNGDFDGDDNISSSKIYIKNPKIYFGLPKQETEIGYANYESIFRTNSKYYQKLTPNGVWEINNNLKAVPPINTELDVDGPFDFYIDADYQLTEDTTPDPNKVYYQLNHGNYIQYDQAPDNPKAVKAYEYIAGYNVKRYLPKLYYKDEQGNYNTSSIIKVQYYDDLLYFAAPNSVITTHDWHDNKYKWDQEEAQWALRERGTLSETEYPDALIPYVCYLPGKQIASYFGAIEKNNTTPQIGISSSEQNIDVTLASSASNANVVLEAYNNRNITLQGNEDIIINNNNKSQIKVNEDLLLIKNINNGNGNGIKLSNNPPDTLTNKGEVTVRLGYTDGQPAINISIQNNTGSDRRNLTIIADSANGFIMNTDNDDLPILFKVNNKNIGKLRCFINNSSQPQINFAMYNSAGNVSSVAFTKSSIETLANLIN